MTAQLNMTAYCSAVHNYWGKDSQGLHIYISRIFKDADFPSTKIKIYNFENFKALWEPCNYDYKSIIKH